MEHIVEVDGIVTGFNITEQCIDCMCGKELIKIDKYSCDIILKKTVFEKKGLSRKMIVHDGQIFVYDFCTLYLFSQEQLMKIPFIVPYGTERLLHSIDSRIRWKSLVSPTAVCGVSKHMINT